MNITRLISHYADATAIQAHDADLSYSQLCEVVERTAQQLSETKLKRVGLYSDNSAAWVCFDLACMQADITLIPLPLFFTDAQIQHVFEQANLDGVFADRDLPSLLNMRKLPFSCVQTEQNDQATKRVNLSFIKALNFYKTASGRAEQPLPKNSAKVTFTSGSTGQAKGVCLSAQQQFVVARSVLNRVNLLRPKHLVMLPLSTLLENIAGVYAPLLAGGCLSIPNEQERGFQGSQLVDVKAFLECISTAQANTLITVPELLKVMLLAFESGWRAPASFKFIAVGGAKVASDLLLDARQKKLPVYQGYGLSECCSVISLAGPEDPADSCGSLLEHASATIKNGELHVQGSTFLGYLGDKNSWYPKSVATGDLASIVDNKLYIKGRRKQQMINSFGRNISPEWAESLILAMPLVNQVFVVGESRPFCIAIISIHEHISIQSPHICSVEQASSNLQPSYIHNKLTQHLYHINQQLPDYAQVKKFILLPEPMSATNNLVTANGRIKRDIASQHFAQVIQQAYLLDATNSHYFDVEHAANKVSTLSSDQELINDII